MGGRTATGPRLFPLVASETTTPGHQRAKLVSAHDILRSAQPGETSYLHQVPAVDMSVLGAAQDVGVFTGQAAVQLVALHLMSCIPKANTPRSKTSIISE